ncbi:hypothetical protein [Nocardioides koreensis]
MVLDVEYALDGLVADLVRHELDRGGRVHVVLVLPRLGWSTDAALVAVRRSRIAAARERRLEELAVIAGPRSAQVTVRTRRHRWRRPTTGQYREHRLTHHPTQEGSNVR